MQKINKILIARTDKIGDLVLSIPSFYMARKMYPDAKIAVLVREYNMGVVKNLSFIDEVWSIDSIGPIALRKRVAKFKADAFIALYSDMRILRLAMKSGAKKRIGPLSKPLSWFIYNRGLAQQRSKSVKNEAEYNLDLIKALDPERYDKVYDVTAKISYTDANEAKAKAYLETEGVKDKFIMIHPFSGASAKNLSIDQYIKLIEMIAKILPDTDIVISSSQFEAGTLMMIKKRLPSPKIHSYVNSGDILSLAALIDRAELFIGASTGPTHIAGNLQKKVIAIYPAKASQSPIRWGCFGNDNVDYIIPDADNPDENYKNKDFDKIDDSLLLSIAEKAAAKL